MLKSDLQKTGLPIRFNVHENYYAHIDSPEDRWHKCFTQKMIVRVVMDGTDLKDTTGVIGYSDTLRTCEVSL